MSSIALIHSGKSFMPEIEAYQTFFERHGFSATILVNPVQSDMEPYEVLWFFMGIRHSLNAVNKKKIIVHEYCSASTPPFARMKDLVKKVINAKPDLRISLAPFHKGTVFPIDATPLLIRNQGVHESFFIKKNYQKEYDFIYTGSALKMRHTRKWLHAFANAFPEKSIVLVGNHESAIVSQFRSNSKIEFKSPVSITELPNLLARAHFAINYVPDIYPFNLQPSTKFLEYCAAGCNVISNKYEWVDRFCLEKQKASIFLLEDGFKNLTRTNLESFEFVAPDVAECRWDLIFEEMQLAKILLL